MRTAIISLDIAWADVDENLNALDAAMQSLHGDVDLVVLPELFSTGYVADSEIISRIAETSNGRTIDHIKNLSNKYGCAIAGSFLASGNNQFFNRAFFIEPSGEETFYDKAHLFSLSQESKIYTSGNSSYPVVRYRGWNIAMIVCYDLRFPVWCRSVAQSYDMMLVPANWPQSRAYAWKHLIIARAIENQAAYIGADRSGCDDFGCYDSMIVAVDAMGKELTPEYVIRPNEATRSEIVVIDYNLDHLKQCRTKLPFQLDGDDFNLNML